MEKNILKVSIIFVFWFLCVVTYAQNPSSAYSFFVAGHTYGSPGVNNKGFHPPFKAKFEYIQSRSEIKLGVLTGDIVSPNPKEKDWDEIDADIDLLGLPIYFAVGNHDMENRTLYESRYGDTYYSFTFENDLFIILDPNLDSWSITGDQLSFLQNVVDNNYLSSRNVYVFFHQVMWRPGAEKYYHIQCNSYVGIKYPLNFWTTVMPIFSTLPNQVFMFAGDIGVSWASDVSYDLHKNVTLISSGMGDKNGENFIVVNILENGNVDFDLICLSDTLNCLGDLEDYLVVDDREVVIDELLIYPNPANGEFKISSYQDCKLQLFNINGQLVHEQKCTRFDRTVNVSSFQKGFYIVKVIYEKSETTRKIIIE